MALKLGFSPHPSVHFNIPKPCCRMISSSLRRRHHRRRLLKYHPRSSPPFTEQTLKVILTVERLSISEPVNYLSALLDSSQSHLDKFISAADEALDDLRSLVTVDSSTNRRVLVSCRRSTVNFLGALVLSSLIITFIFWRTIKFLFQKFNKYGDDANNGGLIYRRDRSLGGKEVIIGKLGKFTNEINRNSERKDDGRRVSFWQKRKKRFSGNKLPDWWPLSRSDSGIEVDDREKYQEMANRLIRAILDNRMRGKDISAEDIVQLRHICRISGVRVHIDPENARDSLYRTAIDFALNCCESTGTEPSFVHISGEDVRHFIVGLSENIGIESSQAARMVSATVAARTRSRILQAWALEMQGNHPEAVAELLKICLIHRIFRPDECSPEMEMVSQSLERHLRLDQRKFLLDRFIEVCGEEAPRTVAEALGLMKSKSSFNDEQHQNHV